MSARTSELGTRAIDDRPVVWREWAEHGRRAWARLGSQRATTTVFVDGDGVIAWPAAPGAPPLRQSSFEAWAAAHPGGAADLVLSGHLLHSMTLANSVMTGADTLLGAASVQFGRYHGHRAERWPVAVGACAGAGFACALHGLALDTLVAAAAAHDIELRSAVPLWSEALAAAAQRAPSLVDMASANLFIVEHSLVTCCSIAEGELVDVQQRFLDNATAPALEDLAERLEAEETTPIAARFAAGWGLDGAGIEAAWHTLGRLDGRVEESGWLMVARLRWAA